MNRINLGPLDRAIEWAEREQAGQHIEGEPVWSQKVWLATGECGTSCCIAGRIALDAGYVSTDIGACGDVNVMTHPETGDVGTPAEIAYRIVLGDAAEDPSSGPYQVMDDLTDGGNGLYNIRANRDRLARLAESGW